jgi:hypothetical protein
MNGALIRADVAFCFMAGAGHHYNNGGGCSVPEKIHLSILKTAQFRVEACEKILLPRVVFGGCASK